MNVGAASALALTNYQTTLNSYGQGSASTAASTGSSASTSASAQNSAVLQALANTYTSLTSNSNGILPAPDALSALAGSGALTPLVSGITPHPWPAATPLFPYQVSLRPRRRWEGWMQLPLPFFSPGGATAGWMASLSRPSTWMQAWPWLPIPTTRMAFRRAPLGPRRPQPRPASAQRSLPTSRLPSRVLSRAPLAAC